MKKEDLSIDALIKASKSLEVALAQPKNEFTRDATIQRFEYTYELAWKSLKRYLTLFVGVEPYSVKDIYREAAKVRLIESVEDWFAFHAARNLTSHTYNEKTAEDTYQQAIKFSPAVNKLIANLEKAIANASK